MRYSVHQFYTGIPAFEQLLCWIRLKVPEHAAIGITAEYFHHLQDLLRLGKGELVSHFNSFVNKFGSGSVTILVHFHSLVECVAKMHDMLYPW